MKFHVFRGPRLSRNINELPPTPALKESFIRSSQAAWISSIHRCWLAGRFIDIGGISKIQGQRAGCAECRQSLDPKETFIRSQLAVFSLIFRKLHNTTWISWISGSGVRCRMRMDSCPLRKPLLDPSWLLFHRFIQLSMLAAGLPGWLPGWLAGRLAGLAGGAGWLAGLLTGWPAGWPAGWPTIEEKAEVDVCWCDGLNR